MCNNSQLGEDSVNLDYMAELLSRNHCRQRKTMSKWSSGPKRTNTKQQSSEIKSFGLTKHKIKIFGINKGVYMQLNVGERTATPCMTPTVKHGGGSSLVVGVLFPISKSRICTWWRTNWIRPAIIGLCSITGSNMERGLLLKNFCSSKIMTQSILVNSARCTLKTKRNTTPFSLCFSRRTKRTSIPLNWCGMILTEKSEINKQLVRRTYGTSFRKAAKNLWSSDIILMNQKKFLCFSFLFNLYIMWLRKTCI